MVTARSARCVRNLITALAFAATVLVAPNAGAAATYTQIAAGDGYTCGLQEGGRIVCRGYNRYGQTNVPKGRYRAVDAGPFSLTCALTQARHAPCWGYGPSHEKKVPAGGSYARIAAGNGLACAMTIGGSVRCWG
ncbi:MAG: hypothetical protein LC790_03825, partial [Actinobacteria bacterium]|nr:hypothetical protein [Actinomycetota bacterium]